MKSKYNDDELNLLIEALWEWVDAHEPELAARTHRNDGTNLYLAEGLDLLARKTGDMDKVKDILALAEKIRNHYRT